MGCLVALAGVVLALFIGVPVAVDQGAPSPASAPSPAASELVVARAADGAWEVVATVDDEFICSAFRRGRSESSGCATSLPPDAIALATGSDRPPVAHGIVRDDVDVVRLELATGEIVDVDVVSLGPLGLKARAFAARVPRFDDIVWFVALDVDRRELGRTAGPAGPQPTFGPQPTAESLRLPASTGPLICGEYRVTKADGQADIAALVEAGRAVIGARLGALGVEEPIVEPLGEDGLSVQARGDEARLRQLIVAPGQVAFVPVPRELDAEVADGSPVPEGMADVEPLFTSEGIAHARAVIDEPGLPAIDLVLTPDAARIFDEHAGTHMGERFAIVVDGVVRSAPSIDASDFGGEARISGGSAEDVVATVAVLTSGPLPVALDEVGFGPCEGSV